MDLNTNQKTWERLKKKLKEKYPQLTEEDLEHKEGKEESMWRMVENKLQKSKLEMRKIIENFKLFSHLENK